MVEATIFHRYGLHRRAIDLLGRILQAAPGHAEAAGLREAYGRELAELQTRASAADTAVHVPSRRVGVDAAATTAAAADDTAPSARAPASAAAVAELFDAEPTGATEAPRPSPTMVHGTESLSASFTLGDDALDVDALIAAAIPQSGAQVQQGAEAALQALAAPATDGPAPEDAATHYNLGIAYREMGLYDEAIAQLRRVPRGGAHGADALYAVGLCHLAAGRASEAAATLHQAREGAGAGEAQVAATYALALAERMAGKDGEGTHHLQEVAERAPNYRDVHALLEPARAPGAERDALQALLAGASPHA